MQQDGFNRNGAFVTYLQRGSIQSLPDAALMQINTPTSITSNYDLNSNTILPIKQNVDKNNNKLQNNNLTESNFADELELDTLVAELELNTSLVKSYFIKNFVFFKYFIILILIFFCLF